MLVGTFFLAFFLHHGFCVLLRFQQPYSVLPISPTVSVAGLQNFLKCSIIHHSLGQKGNAHNRVDKYRVYLEKKKKSN